MFLKDFALIGLGTAVALGHAARDGFNALARRGQAVAAGDATLAGTLDRVLTQDVPTMIGRALGTAVEGAIRSVECARGAIDGVPAAADRAVTSMLGYAGVPSSRDLVELRARLDRLSAQLDRLAHGAQAPAPPWEEPPDDTTMAQ